MVVAAGLASLVGLVALTTAPSLGPGEHSLVGESRVIVSGGGDLVLVLDNPPTRGLIESLRLIGGKKPDLAVALMVIAPTRRLCWRSPSGLVRFRWRLRRCTACRADEPCKWGRPSSWTI